MVFGGLFSSRLYTVYISYLYSLYIYIMYMYIYIYYSPGRNRGHTLFIYVLNSLMPKPKLPSTVISERGLVEKLLSLKSAVDLVFWWFLHPSARFWKSIKCKLCNLYVCLSFLVHWVRLKLTTFSRSSLGKGWLFWSIRAPYYSRRAFPDMSRNVMRERCDIDGPWRSIWAALSYGTEGSGSHK